jgi:DNA polymerase III subunit delta'
MEFNFPVKEFLQGTLKEKRISQSYIFLGEKGVGKEEMALWYEKQLNPDKKKNRFNLLLIKPEEEKQNILIQQIDKEMRHWLVLRPNSGYQLVVINPAELMTPRAQNSLLKILEEPKPQMIIILLARRLQGLKKTILSRCQILRFQKLSSEEVREWLKKEGLKVDEIEKVVFLGEGKVERIKFLLNHRKEISAEMNSYQELKALLGGDLISRLNWLEKPSSSFSKADLEKFLYSALNLYRRFLLQKTGKEKELFSLPASYSWSRIFHALQALEETKNLLSETNVNKKLLLNQLFINL